MKISSLIKRLSNILTKEGDIDVYFHIEEYDSPIKNVRVKTNDIDYIGSDKIVNLT